MIILGIDPGTATMGYGLIEAGKPAKTRCLDYGCILTEPTLPQGERLVLLQKELRAMIAKHHPEMLAVESMFFFRNQKTAIPVSQACGVVLLTASQKKVPVYEFTPPQVKLMVGNFGLAKKKDIQEEVKKILSLKEIPKPDDAADALAVALTCVRKLEI